MKRAYAEPAKEDGYRVLVERLWPRGVKKEALRLDEWLKEVAPTTELRKWYGHDSSRWAEFQRRYQVELENHPEQLVSLLERIRGGDTVTFVFASWEEDRNSAVVLKEYVERRLSE